MNPGVRVVELIGPPGSGKSTVAAAVAASPGFVVLKDHEVRDVPALAGAVLAAARLVPLRPPPDIPRRRWIAWLGRVGAAPRTTRRRLAKARVVLLDQGPAYTLGRMAAAAERSSTVARWHAARTADCGRLLDAVVWLDADPEVLAVRVRGRSKPHRVKALAGPAAVRRLGEERERSRAMVADLAAAGVAVLHIGPDQSLTDAIVAVRALVEAVP